MYTLTYTHIYLDAHIYLDIHLHMGMFINLTKLTKSEHFLKVQ